MIIAKTKFAAAVVLVGIVVLLTWQTLTGQDKNVLPYINKPKNCHRVSALARCPLYTADTPATGSRTHLFPSFHPARESLKPSFTGRLPTLSPVLYRNDVSVHRNGLRMSSLYVGE
jgi:hypothetical protein